MSEPRHLLGAIAALTLILALPATAAEPEYSPDFADGLAGGPEHWAVANVSANDVLNVRADAGTSSDVIGALANGDVCLNRGCRMAGEQRWCRIETLGDQHVLGWVNGHYLVEAAAPGSGERQVIRRSEDGPDVVRRASGELEVVFPEGCVALYDGNGSSVTAGATCSAQQLRQAQEAVTGYRRD